MSGLSSLSDAKGCLLVSRVDRMLDTVWVGWRSGMGGLGCLTGSGCQDVPTWDPGANLPQVAGYGQPVEPVGGLAAPGQGLVASAARYSQLPGRLLQQPLASGDGSPRLAAGTRPGWPAT